jgi:hypothetical protein
MVHARTNRLARCWVLTKRLVAGSITASGTHLRSEGASPYRRELIPTVQTTQKGDPPTPLLDGTSKPFYMTGSLEIFGKHG